MDTIVIVDYGSQYTQCIARKIRECEVFSVIEKPEIVTDEYIAKNQPRGIILSGSPASINDDNAPQLHFDILKADCPILGICYGFHLLVKTMGGQLERTKDREFGKRYFFKDETHDFFQNTIFHSYTVWMSHSDTVINAPGFQNIGRTQSTEWAAAFLKKKPDILGVQFHPEVSHTFCGQQMLKNFALTICQAKPQWRVENIVSSLIEETKKEIGEKSVIHGISGGIDSTTLAYLLHRALGDESEERLFCVFIDHGLHRKNEVEEFLRVKEQFPFRCQVDDFSNFFLRSLRGIADGEKKRWMIGRCFATIFWSLLGSNSNKILAHGTIYPDTIETSPQIGTSDKIKTHHNRSEAFKDLPLLEPFKLLFKDEVKKIARVLGVPKEIIKRQPFPGPGLAVRILGEVTTEKLEILREADAIFREEIDKSRYNPAQYFAVLHNDESVGIRGDERHKGPIISLVAIESEDFMTAEASEFFMEFIKQVGRRITNEIPEVNRILYSISDKPPATIEFM